MKVRAIHIILGAAAIGGLYWLYRQLSQKISVGFPSISFSDLSLTSVKLITEWPVTNDSQVTVSVDGFVGGIFQGQKKLADVNIANPTTLTAGQTTTLTSVQTIGFANLAANFVTSISTGTWATPLYLRGKMIVDGASIPVNMDMNILPI